MAKKKTPPATPIKSGFSIKEWTAFGISIIAFFMSLLTTWLTTFRVEDDLRAIFQTFMTFHGEYENPGRAKIFGGDGFITISNSGNRPAAISEMNFYFHRLTEETADVCSGPKIAWFSFDIEPFILKPREIETKRIKLNRKDLWPLRPNRLPDGELTIFTDGEAPQDNFRYQVASCIGLFFSTSTETGSKFWPTLVLELEYKRQNGELSLVNQNKKFQQDNRKPVILLQHSTNIFSN